MQLDLPHIKKFLFSHLDDLTNKGLYFFAKMLTGETVKFEKTHRKMKKLIRESLSKILNNRGQNHHQADLSTLLSKLLEDRDNFRKNYITLWTAATQCHHDAVMKVLDGLEDMPFQTLNAMHRKLKGVKGGVPQLHHSKSGWSRDRLVCQVRSTSLEMLSELGEGDVLQEPLAKAMAVANLSLKITPGNPNSLVTEFQQFPPEIESLQNNIIKAIWLLKYKVRPAELKNLQLVLDPKAELSKRSLKTAIGKLLTEYLFECGDLDTIPKFLLETLDIINRRSQSSRHSYFSNKEIEEEVEHVLSVSAQMKQILWDLLPDRGLDQDFTDAYVEDLDEDYDSDNYDDWEQNSSKFQISTSHSSYSCQLMGSIGDSNTIDCKPSTSSNQEIGSPQLVAPIGRSNGDSTEGAEPGNISDMNLIDPQTSPIQRSKFLNSVQTMGTNQVEKMDERGPTYSNLVTSTMHMSDSPGLVSANGRLNDNSVERQDVEANTGIGSVERQDFVSANEEKILPDNKSMSRNEYLAFQEVCDKTSMVAYHLIGRSLELFALREGFDLDFSAESYLRGNFLISEDFQVAEKRQTSFKEDVDDSVILQAVEEQIPSFPKSQMDKLKELMGLR
ncbi:uncharacterized protein LOC131150947 isoform X2 [Malania oleifera]|nr:uncharacterized protein LOC131150947 isoform X2 [Malania oleifera]